MKNLTLLSTTFIAALSLPAFAADTKISGEATCAKCTLKKVDSCQMAITTKTADGKEETLMVEKNKVAKDFHENICTSTEKVNAEGTISEKDGQKILTLSKVELAK